MATTQISLRLNQGLHLMSLLCAAHGKCTVTDVLQRAMRAALEAEFADVPALAKEHFASMIAEGDVSMEDAKVALRLAAKNVAADFEVGSLFAVVDDQPGDGGVAAAPAAPAPAPAPAPVKASGVVSPGAARAKK